MEINYKLIIVKLYKEISSKGLFCLYPIAQKVFWTLNIYRWIGYIKNQLCFFLLDNFQWTNKSFTSL